MKAVIRYILDELDGLERESTHSAEVRGLTDLVSFSEAHPITNSLLHHSVSTPFERMTMSQWLRYTLLRETWSGIATMAASREVGIRAICATRPE
ncbi:hypothetical protein GB937_009373 [Aspergillus fischeri]|nr:hypothetical protein GB937_009373 [Aspergillus fischeri]